MFLVVCIAHKSAQPWKKSTDILPIFASLNVSNMNKVQGRAISTQAKLLRNEAINDKTCNVFDLQAKCKGEVKISEAKCRLISLTLRRGDMEPARHLQVLLPNRR